MATIALLVPWLATSVAWATPQAAAAAKTAPAFNGALWTFYIFGALTIAGALLTITRRNPVTAALWLVFTLFATAGVYLSLHATFMAAIQVLVYAGAIMVLFMFVVMMVGNTERQEFGIMRGLFSKVVALGAIALLGWRLISLLMRQAPAKAAMVSDGYGSVHSMGGVLFREYLFPFEAISVLLLVAIVGAVVISRRSTEEKEEV
ncbi:MAG: NADH-quinone oxidoreductase subunit J [Deltaproteobacteria bacterium]|nr:NADH-quinone oxidoreductase subunit J [Deltaproteobacteria bacterium]